VAVALGELLPAGHEREAQWCVRHLATSGSAPMPGPRDRTSVATYRRDGLRR
jgi:hypothetical protein